ncbi:MAG: MFS transporter [Anaerolineaceae bacterium]|nr:MFS transporter [Anaerolineaceae bacterium]
MENEVRKHLKFNYAVNQIDGWFFGLGSGFASTSTIIPLFLSQFTDSPILIGLIPAILTLGWQLPQLFFAKKIASLRKFKGMVMQMTIHERIPYLGFGLIAIFADQLSNDLAIILIFIMISWAGLGGGITGNAWQNLVCKIIPGEMRGSFLSIQAAGLNLFASVGAILAGNILEKQTGMNGFAYLFFFATISMILSYISIALTREHESEEVLKLEDAPPLIDLAKKIIKGNPLFRWFLTVRFLAPFATMSTAFYVVYILKHFNVSESRIGVMTSILFFTSVIANLVFGWISDHVSRKLSMMIGVSSILFSALLAFLAPNENWFYLVFVLTGIGNATFWSVFMTFTLDFGTDVERPTYVGLMNTLIAPSTLIAQLGGGWIADRFDYSSTFFIASLFGIILCLIVYFFIHDPKPEEGVHLETEMVEQVPLA